MCHLAPHKHSVEKTFQTLYHYGLWTAFSFSNLEDLLLIDKQNRGTKENHPEAIWLPWILQKVMPYESSLGSSNYLRFWNIKGMEVKNGCNDLLIYLLKCVFRSPNCKTAIFAVCILPGKLLLHHQSEQVVSRIAYKYRNNKLQRVSSQTVNQLIIWRLWRFSKVPRFKMWAFIKGNEFSNLIHEYKKPHAFQFYSAVWLQSSSGKCFASEPKFWKGYQKVSEIEVSQDVLWLSLFLRAHPMTASWSKQERRWRKMVTF